MKGEEFLNQIYKDLHLSDEVTHTSRDAENKYEAVKRYMDRLETTHNKVSSKHKLDLLKTFYYKKYIVKEVDIPRYRDKEKIINAQKEKLDKWLNYLLDENTRYPMWAKYWAFQGMLKIGTYDETTGTYQKRSKKTLAPFIEVNPEVLAKCIGMVVNDVEKTELTDKELEKLVESCIFQKLYPMLLKKYQNNLLTLGDKESGIWITYYYETKKEVNKKFENGIEPEYLKLYNSLQGYNTGWCTAGDKETAKDQICGIEYYKGGNFYVYYTKDENNEYKVPRIAIRMDGSNEIGEIRGIEDSQNLEEGLEDIVENKLYTLGLENEKITKNLKIIANLRKLTELNKKTKNNIQFNNDDLRFIYGEIECFGWEKDSRIEKIIKTRNKENDFQKLSKEDIKEIIKKRPLFIKYVQKDINDYKEIVQTALKEDCVALKYVPIEIDDYTKIALETVKQNGIALKYIPIEVKDYEEIALEAIKQNSLVLSQIPKEVIIRNKKIALEAVKQNSKVIKYVPTNIENYEEIALEAIKRDIEILKYIPTDIEGYKTIVLEVIKHNSWNLVHVPQTIEGYKDIALEAVKQNVKLIEHIPTNIEGYKEIALEVVKKDGELLRYVPSNTEGYKEISMEAVKQNGIAIMYVPTDMENYKEIALEAIKQNPYVVYLFIPKEIECYKEIELAAIKEIEKRDINEMEQRSKNIKK